MDNKEFKVRYKCDGRIYIAKRFWDMTPEEVSSATNAPSLWVGDEIFIIGVRPDGGWLYVWDSEIEIIDDESPFINIYVIGSFDERGKLIRYVRKGRNNAISAYDSLSSAKRGLGQTRGAVGGSRKLQYKLIEFNTGEVIE